jgi:hypothetical protein
VYLSEEGVIYNIRGEGDSYQKFSSDHDDGSVSHSIWLGIQSRHPMRNLLKRQCLISTQRTQRKGTYNEFLTDVLGTLEFG